MADSCCSNKAEDLKSLAQKQAKVLWTVLIINFAMFFVEAGSGLHFESLALLGDSLDMLGDAIAYGSSLFVLNKSLYSKARASQLKAWIMILLGLFVAGRALYRSFYVEIPDSIGMSAIGTLALLANIYCLWLLSKHKDDDINFTSVWICSRNDIIANTSVLLAAALVYFTHNQWPDIIVGAGIAFLFLRSAIGILSEAKQTLVVKPRST